MDPLPRHQCLIYAGSPSPHLPEVAAAIIDWRRRHYRCLYLNSQPMVAGMRSCLAAAGVDVLNEIANGSLILSSGQSHLREGKFDPGAMIRMLRDAVDEARADGYAGLWASGDMTWEFGPHKDFQCLLEYEWRLEELFRQRTDLAGICQYHAGTLPPEYLRQGFVAHRCLFLNHTLSRINPHHLPQESFSLQALNTPEVDTALRQMLGVDTPL